MPKAIKKVNKLRHTAHAISPHHTFFARSASRAQPEYIASHHFTTQDAETSNKKFKKIFQIKQTAGFLTKPNHSENLNLQPTQSTSIQHVKSSPRQITDITQTKTTELTLLTMAPPTEKFNTLGIMLVYGFEAARDLSPEQGIKKFTLNQINDALGIDYGKINHTLISSIAQGIVVDKAKIEVFSKLTHIDKGITKKLLRAYADFLRDHYDYLSISACLKRKAQKYYESFSKYTFNKNNHHLQKFSDNEIARFSKVFYAFLSEDDQQGYIQKETFLCDQDKTKAQIGLNTALDNLIFRRISKLGLIWSAHYSLPLTFYRTFTPEEAKNKVHIESYEPITFSEYRLISRLRPFFPHIKDIDRSLILDQTPALTLRT